ncbi:MAG: NADAR family protein [Bacteroidota bacterium]
MQYTRNWLIQQADSQSRLKYLHFWGHKPAPDGLITATCFSQWWEGHPFDENGHTYLTTEHYMMAGKARLFKDDEMLVQILACESPGEAKKLGRQVRNFDQETWKMHRCDIVIQGNYLKFSQHQGLKTFLLQTGERIIVEASPRDRIWGIGMGRNNENAENPEKWRGSNLLGFCLMEVRDRLRLETA